MWEPVVWPSGWRREGEWGREGEEREGEVWYGLWDGGERGSGRGKVGCGTDRRVQPVVQPVVSSQLLLMCVFLCV